MNFSQNTILLLILFGLIATLNYYYKAIDNNLAQLGRHWFRSSIFFNYIFFVGTMIHELSHAITAILLGVRVYKISLFWPQSDGSGGYRLGYVEHKKVDPIRTTLIGIAPIFGCALVTFLVFIWAVPSIDLNTKINLATMLDGFKFIALNITKSQSLVFIYIAVACSLAGDPSDADKKSLPWIFAIFILISALFYFTRDMTFWNHISKGGGYVLSNIEPFVFGMNAVLIFELLILTAIYAITKILRPRV
jgi:hypothetical protein